MMPCVPTHCEQPFHMFFVRMPSLQARTALTAALRTKNIQPAFHYVPLHTSEMGGRFGGTAGQCPVAEHAADCLLRLPFYTAMTSLDQERVIEAVRDFR
jgi:dTDP-4-amino-4,6-dideoxygalactose transaminase